MSWFRRRDETLNEKLLREAGYSPEGTAVEAVAAADPQEREPELEPDPAPRSSREFPGTLGYRSVRSLPREPDALATVECPELSGESYSFTTLPDGTLIVDDSCTEDLSRLADAVEQHLKPPYSATAVRHDDRLWLVSARQIKVAQVAADGDEVELTSVEGEHTCAIDGQSVDAAHAPPELVSLGEARWDDYAVHAVRLDGELWEVDVDPL